MHYNDSFVVDNNFLSIVVYRHKIEDATFGDKLHYDKITSILDCKFINPIVLCKFIKKFNKQLNGLDILIEHEVVSVSNGFTIKKKKFNPQPEKYYLLNLVQVDNNLTLKNIREISENEPKYLFLH